jgi:Iron-containing redox enzyme
MREAGARVDRPPTLPAARGPASAELFALLRGEPAAAPSAPVDALGEDAQLAQYVCYELHYRGFAGVDPDMEWDPVVLGLRRELEARFETALRALVDPHGDTLALRDELEALTAPPGNTGPAAHLLRHPNRPWLRELVAHRSMYHLKEADPQAFVLPRLSGAAKSLVAGVEFDEYGGGDPARSHSLLFAELMQDLDLDPSYGAYLDVTPAPMLALVNLMSWCGLHRRLRGALIGQLALVELSSPLSSQRMVQVLQRHDAGPAAERFYAEHVVADSVHERVMREAIAELITDEPALTADIVFGIRAALVLEQRLDEHLLACWRSGRSSLRQPI